MFLGKSVRAGVASRKPGRREFVRMAEVFRPPVLWHQVRLPALDWGVGDHTRPRAAMTFHGALLRARADCVEIRKLI